jgi:hypothetical protein
MRIVKMQNTAFVVELRRNQTLAAKGASGAESFVEKVEVSHAVQEWQDRSCRSNRWSKRIDGSSKVIGFAAEQDEIEVTAQFAGLDGGGRLERDIAKAAFDYQTGFSELSSPLRPDEKSDIATGLEQSAAKVSADRTGADDENPHDRLPYWLGFIAVMFIGMARRGDLSITLDRTTLLT